MSGLLFGVLDSVPERAEGVEGSTVRVRGIDVLDGTPLLDIKPCIRQFDRRDEVRSFSPEDLREYEGSS